MVDIQGLPLSLFDPDSLEESLELDPGPGWTPLLRNRQLVAWLCFGLHLPITSDSPLSSRAFGSLSMSSPDASARMVCS